jgi:hypothetical protein
MDISRWRETANGNLLIVIVVRGVGYRVVLFKHKKTPTFGALRINTDTDESTFMRGWHPTREEARAQGKPCARSKDPPVLTRIKP